MKILMVSMEMVPFAKVGGLADVIGSLPKELSKYSKVDVILPYYGSLTDSLYKKFYNQDLKLVKILENKLLNNSYGIYQVENFGNNNFKVYLFKSEKLFEREGIYLDKTGKPFEDEFFRYLVFNLAVVDFIKQSDYDIIHCHDWHTSFTILYLKYLNLTNKTIFTIHNIAYQGIFSKEILDNINIDTDFKRFILDKCEYYSKINLMKGAIELSNIISTVSPNYANEIQNYSEFGMGLENILKLNSHKLVGILNGIDYELWNPLTDNSLYKNYDINNVNEGKKENKLRLLMDLRLLDNLDNYDLDIPLFGVVARLDYQKGFDILYDSFKKLMDSSIDAYLVVLGTGNIDIQKQIEKLAVEYPKFVSVNIKFSEDLARKIYAASDFFLIPSRFEPCGLSQMISYKYGTIPIATKTGGLKDSVIDIFEDRANGTGILIEKANSDLLFEALKKAHSLYKNKDFIFEFRKKLMKLDFSWNTSSKKYFELYNQLMSIIQ
ncbi:MAG: glycogen synthase [bacterium]|nr:glycogen synthase [bacterium]